MKTATREINRELVNEQEQHILEHMLGVGSQYPKEKWGFRNIFFAPPWADNGKALIKMKSRGLVKSFECEDEESFVFIATELGCKAIGLHKAAIKRAME
jgi:hypothetical protein